MVCMGLRATPNEVFFSIAELEKENFSLNTVDKIIVPKALTVPDKLSYMRIAILTIINEYSVEKAILRRCEDNAKTKDTFRMYLEGVTQELISNCTIEKYDTCKLSQLGSLINKKDSELKKCIDGENLFLFESWNFKKEERESILCALAATQL